VAISDLVNRYSVRRGYTNICLISTLMDLDWYFNGEGERVTHFADICLAFCTQSK